MTHVFSPDAADWSNNTETRAERDARRHSKGERARAKERIRQRIRELKVSWTV
jgi:hypothetical protein